MRKLSRRTTILMVALGVLLTASIALAGMAVNGSVNFDVVTADATPPAPDPLEITVTQTNPDAGPISGTHRARFDISVHNPNDEGVTLGTDPVVFSMATAVGACDIDDLQFNEPDDLDGVTIPGGGTVTDNFSVKLKPASAADCDGVTLTITVTVTGETENAATVSGSSSV